MTIKFKSTIQIIFLGVFSYIVQKMIFKLVPIDTSEFNFSLEKTYSLLLFLSVIIMGILDFVFQKNKDIVGMTFLFITSVKVVAITIIGKTVLKVEENTLEKWNYFGLFLLFLFFETLITARRLNATKF